MLQHSWDSSGSPNPEAPWPSQARSPECKPQHSSFPWSESYMQPRRAAPQKELQQLISEPFFFLLIAGHVYPCLSPLRTPLLFVQGIEDVRQKSNSCSSACADCLVTSSPVGKCCWPSGRRTFRSDCRNRSCRSVILEAAHI